MIRSYSLFFLLLIAMFGWSGCKQKKPITLTQPLDLRWELISNQIGDQDGFRAVFTLVNNNVFSIKNNWVLYFNQTNRFIKKNEGPGVVSLIDGDFYKLEPTQEFNLSPGDSTQIIYEGNAWMIKESDAPAGLYFTVGTEKNETLIPVENYEILPYLKEEQVQRFKNDYEEMMTAEKRFMDNTAVGFLDLENPKNTVAPVLPTPLQFSKKSGELKLNESFLIQANAALASEAKYLQKSLDRSGFDLKISDSNLQESKVIELVVDKHQALKDGYQLVIEDNILIRGNSPTGIFYGIQSLLQLIPNEHFYNPDNKEIILPKIMMTDRPRFAYRGVHLDIARNFNDQTSILKLIDAMAFFKLNKLHLHLTEDEGWRLEIAGLPELTEYGARRGHTLTEATHLHPSYGSGPSVTGDRGTGYLTRAQFQEILVYAMERHIEIIPEINVPGHARAAIKSMDARYRKWMRAGDRVAATQFLLRDTADQSEYLSVQNYPDNVVCPCLESTYHFYETVVADLVAQYEEVGLKLETLHTGGDEVPNGVWEKSPACAQMMAENKSIQKPYDLIYYFRSRLAKICKKYDLTLAGWEEIALRREDSGRYVPNEDFKENNFLPYVWNNLWGAQDLSNRLANSGYPVVLTNVTNLYFDMAYDNDPEEPGFYWGGFVDTKKVWEFMPHDVLNATYEDAMGKPMDPEKDYANMERLTEKGRENILGIQGQLWSETIKGSGMLEYFYMPKLTGLAERAWSQPPNWRNDPLSKKSLSKRAENWNVFANQLGQHVLPKLDVLAGGYGYRIPPVGAKLKDGLIHANVAFPGLTIRYETGTREVTINSPIYQEPLRAEMVKFRVFDSRGRGGRAVVIGLVD